MSEEIEENEDASEVDAHDDDDFGHSSIIETYYQKKSIGDYFQDLVRSSPWWLISFVIHALIIGILAQVAVSVAKPEEEEIIVETDIVEEVDNKIEKQEIQEIIEEDVPEEETEEVETEEVTEDVDVPEIETDVTMENLDTPVESVNEALPNMPTIGGEDLGNLGVGGGGGITGGAFAARKSGKSRGRAAKRFGGGKDVMDAVERALRYLARVQKPDGGWANDKGESKGAHGIGYTGLATLCFLGAGHTEVSGKYRSNVKKALKYLLKLQSSEGLFTHNMYANGIANMAVAEAYAMTPNSRLKKACEKGIKAMLECMNPVGGYDYARWTKKSKKRLDEKTKKPMYPHTKGWRSDSSVMGWQLMAVKSAKVAGIKMDKKRIKLALHAFDLNTDKTNKTVGYCTPGNPSRTTMAAVGMCIKQFFGMKKAHPELIKPAEGILKHGLPSLAEAKKPGKKGEHGPVGYKSNGYYNVYYGSLVMFQQGGKYWREWNKVCKPMLLSTQVKGGPNDGSWNHVTFNANHGAENSRVLGTACYCLALEVYWRYAVLKN